MKKIVEEHMLLAFKNVICDLLNTVNLYLDTQFHQFCYH